MVWMSHSADMDNNSLTDILGQITVESLDNTLPWHWKRYRVENWMQQDASAGRQLIIRLDDDQKSPISAAKALFFMPFRIQKLPCEIRFQSGSPRRSLFKMQ